MASKKIFQKYAYDIAFDDDIGTNLIAWNTGLMVFFVTLTLALNLALSSVSQSWLDDLSGSLTIEMKPPVTSLENTAADYQIQKGFRDKVQELMTMLRNQEVVAEARLLSDNEVRKLIEPWIGENAVLETISLPTLIDVKLANNAADLSNLKLELTKIDPTASVDNHSDTINDIKNVTSTAKGFASLLTIIVIFLAIASISGIIRSKLLIHKNEVETLHLIGASNEYIARQFRQHTLHNTIKGAVIGVVFTIAALLTIGIITRTLNANIFEYFKVMPMHWTLLVIAPVVMGAFIAHLTAQAAALRELSKLT